MTSPTHSPGSAGQPRLPDPAPILDLATGFMAAKQLFVAHRVGIFSQLSGKGLTNDALAARLGLNLRMCTILTAAMHAANLLESDGPVYRNTAAAEEYLSGKNMPHDLGSYLRFLDQISYPNWQHFETSIRTAKPTQEILHEPLRSVFVNGVGAYARVHDVKVAEALDGREFLNVLDIGATSADFLATLCQRNWQLRGTLVVPELRLQGPIAEQVQDLGLEERIRVVHHDIDRGELPREHDLIVLKHLIHRYAPTSTQTILQNIRQNTAPGATLLIIDFFLDAADKQRPLDAKLAGEYQAFDGTMVYPIGELSSWLDHSGWSLVDVIDVPGCPRMVEAVAL